MASLCHLLLFVQLLPLLISAQSNNNITLGSSLSNLDENPYWASPSGDFAFGFHPHGDLFLLAIWFDKILPKTIVWTAHGGVPVGRGARVELTSDGVLSLTAPNGTQLWRAEAEDNGEISHAAMLNTGNFVLSSSANSTFAWESFDHPTDTMLPTQVIPPAGNQLSSRKTEDDYTIGRFEFAIQADGNLVLYTVARPKTNRNQAYWASGTVSNGIKEFVFNQSGYMYLTPANSSTPSYRMPLGTALSLPVSTSDYYLRATLDFDGVLRQYSYPKTIPSSEIWPSSWSPIWSLPEDICLRDFGSLGSGACGFNSYCILNGKQMPVCECPPGYVYIDPQNTFGGCKPDFVPQSCDASKSGTAEGFQMQEITGSNFPFSDYERFMTATEDWCRETCLNDCFCAAAVYNSAQDCWLKKFPLSHGQRTPVGKTLIKVGNLSTKPVSSSTKCDGNEKRWVVPGSVVLGISIFINLLILVITIWGGRYKKETNNTQKQTRSSGVNLQSFTYRELEEATDGFKEELGKGAFSVVYKGVIKSDGGLVAVKRLDRIAEGNDKEFKAEMMAIAKTNHKNLVQLLGFCDEEAHRILVYEFMKNGSLESFLFGSKRLDWYQRIQIAYGIARGLAYLHEDCSSHIIHCDIKPQNILLDEFYEARISDFGLAKLLKSDQTRTMTGIRGTRGYVAPEWFRNMPITSKVDVYSFGIMLLEIICCRKNAILDFGEEDVNILSDWAYECCERKELHLLVEDDEKAKNDGKTLERLVMVSLCCIQEEPSLRPSMKMITQMLEGVVEVYMPSYASSFVSSTSV